MPKYQAEDFSIATAADGDNSARAVKSVAIKGNNIKKARSGFTFFQTHFFAQAKAGNNNSSSDNNNNNNNAEEQQQQEEAMDVDGEEEEEPQEQMALKLADAGIAWKKLSDSEKEPFMEMARKDKERYLLCQSEST